MKTRVIASAIIKNDQGYLLVKRAPGQRFAPNQWEFVSGFINEDETAEEAILREVKEEIGCASMVKQRTSIYEVTDSDGCWVVIPFDVELASDANIRLSSEHSDYRWVGPSDLKGYEELQEDVKLLGLLS